MPPLAGPPTAIADGGDDTTPPPPPSPPPGGADAPGSRRGRTMPASTLARARRAVCPAGGLRAGSVPPDGHPTAPPLAGNGRSGGGRPPRAPPPPTPPPSDGGGTDAATTAARVGALAHLRHAPAATVVHVLTTVLEAPPDGTWEGDDMAALAATGASPEADFAATQQLLAAKWAYILAQATVAAATSASAAAVGRLATTAAVLRSAAAVAVAHRVAVGGAAVARVPLPLARVAAPGGAPERPAAGDAAALFFGPRGGGAGSAATGGAAAGGTLRDYFGALLARAGDPPPPCILLEAGSVIVNLQKADRRLALSPETAHRLWVAAVLVTAAVPSAAVVGLAGI